MSISKGPITTGEQAEADQFYATYGRALAKWTEVEYHLGLLFHALVKGDATANHIIFHSARSWRGRYDMVSAILGQYGGRPEHVKSIQHVIRIANDYSSTRNMLAHDRVDLVSPTTKGMPRRMAIRPQHLGAVMTDAKEALWLEDVKTIAENFGHLSRLIAIVLIGPDDQLGSPERLIRLAGLLPNPAHSARLSPNDAEQFSLGLMLHPRPL